MAGKSLDQRIADTEDRIRQLQARKHELSHQLHQQDRKERTRRLIQIGAVMAKLGIDTLAKAQRLQSEIEGQEKARAWLIRVVSERTQKEDGAQE